jgi:hypothetical protein
MAAIEITLTDRNWWFLAMMTISVGFGYQAYFLRGLSIPTLSHPPQVHFRPAAEFCDQALYGEGGVSSPLMPAGVQTSSLGQPKATNQDLLVP